MDYITELFLICFIGGIISVDTTAAWQIMISRPLVACTILGAILGYFELGLLIGILLEIPWLIEIPAGGAYISEGNLGALIATGLTIFIVDNNINSPNIALVISIVWGLFVSWSGGKLVVSMRKMNTMLAYQADKYAKKANTSRITLLNLIGVGYAFFLGFIIVLISYLIGTSIIAKLASFIPPFFEHAFSYGKIGLMALSVAILLNMFFTKKNFPLIVFGFLFSVISYSIYYISK